MRWDRGCGLGALARAGVPWGPWLGFLSLPSPEFVVPPEPNSSSLASPPAFPKVGATLLGHLGVGSQGPE